MSRSALWRQEVNVKERQRKAEETFLTAVEEGRTRHVKGTIPLSCPDDTFNIHPMLLQNIAKSPYFQKCCEKINDWNSLVDEIYYEVKHMEPWTAGAGKLSSTAFCLLARLFTLRCTEKQMTLMLEHVDSPYIRCVGFLYLRYGCDPSGLWAWVEPYVNDKEPVQICQGKADMTVGEYVRSLLSDLEFYGTRLPRLPVTIERDVKVKLLQSERVEARAKDHEKDETVMEYFQKVGSRVRALYGDDENTITWYDGVVDRVMLRDEGSGELLPRPKFWVHFPEYGNTELVTLGEVDVLGGSLGGREQSGYDRGGDTSRDGRRGESGRNIDRGRRGYDENNRRYDTDRGYGARGEGVDNRNFDDCHGQNRYNRSRERSRSRDRENDMEEVLRREREKSAAKGRAYAARPATFKDSLGAPVDGWNKQRRSPDRDRGRKPREEPRRDVMDRKPVAVEPAAKKSAAELATIEEKKRKLRARYG